jgi:hypothetical protein
MKPLSAILALIVLVLWVGSLVYITAPLAPAQIQSMIPTPPTGNIPAPFLGVLLFLLSIVVIAFWAGLAPDSATDGKKVPATAQKQ